MDPKLCLPARSTISGSRIPELRTKKEVEVKNLLAQAKFVAGTLDLWSDRNCHAYSAITVHTFIDFQPKSALLTFEEFRGSHTGERIAEHLESTLEVNGVDTKMTYVPTDNASNMKKVLGDLLQEDETEDPTDGAAPNFLDDEDLWLDLEEGDEDDVQSSISKVSLGRRPCYAHTLPLVVKDELDKLGGSTSVSVKCNKLANIVHQSTQFREAFDEIFGKNRSVPATNATRWSSVHKQLSVVSTLDSGKLTQLLRDKQMPHLILSSKEHAALAELVEVLQPFAEATEVCQGETYATIGIVVPSVVALHKHLAMLKKSTKYHSSLVAALNSSFSRRFNGLLQLLKILPCMETALLDYSSFGNMLYLVASVLDPVYGLVWLEEDHPGNPDLKLELKNEILDYILREANSIHDTEAAALVAEKDPEPPQKVQRTTLFASYDRRRRATHSTTTQTQSMRSSVLAALEIIPSFFSSDDPWKRLKEHPAFSRLNPLYEKVFCVPATSAPVERVFSHSGLFMRPHRARMSQKLLAALVYLKCNREIGI